MSKYYIVQISIKTRYAKTSLGHYVPPTDGRGDILFLVRIPSASASASASALLRFRALSFEPMDGF